MNSDKKILGVSTIAVIALILIAVGATYAFFKGTDASDTNTPLEVTTNTTDSLIFNVDTNITMVADMSNFTEGKGNREGISHATATLKANNKTNNATGNYYLYFDIKENELAYTTDDNTAELILQVTGPDGLVTSINGLNYVTVTDGKGESISGFDITEVKDLITITSNKEITTTSEKVDNWEIKVVLVNLNEDQSSNGGKKFNGEILIQKQELHYHEYCNSGTFACDIAKKFTGVQGENNIYYHNNLANSAEDSSYRYAGANFKLTSKGEKIYDSVDDTSSTSNGVIKFHCGSKEEYSYIGKTCQETDDYYIYLAYDSDTKYDTYGEAAKKALKDGYIEESVTNYVCFGDEIDGACPYNKLYRIIGVFDGQLKLIKADYAKLTELGTNGDYGGLYNTVAISSLGVSRGEISKDQLGAYYWNYSNANNSTNNWGESNLNKVNLNQNYLNTLGSTWTSKIATTSWKVDGNTWQNIVNQKAATAYQNEVVNPVSGKTTVNKKIGLMYVSDYGFAADLSAWTRILNDYDTDNIPSKNWMFYGHHEWTITPSLDNTSFAFNVMQSGYFQVNSVCKGFKAVRPVFYLIPEITLIGGSGTQENPYRIS